MAKSRRSSSSKKKGSKAKKTTKNSSRSAITGKFVKTQEKTKATKKGTDSTGPRVAIKKKGKK